MSMKKYVSSRSGFTLVELLIVVAIIGVLASQGVPAYQRMIQKSRKGEAQSLLAGVGAAESAFFSEYGQYANNLLRIGVQSDGTNFTYAAGMPAADGCTQLDVTALLPVQGTAVGQVPNLPNNYNTVLPGTTAGQTATSMIGRVAAFTAAGTQLPKCPTAALGTFLAPGVVTGAAPTYVAVASANIVNPNAACVQGATNGANTGADPFCDNWFINEKRNLINVIDGVR